MTFGVPFEPPDLRDGPGLVPAWQLGKRTGQARRPVPLSYSIQQPIGCPGGGSSGRGTGMTLGSRSNRPIWARTNEWTGREAFTTLVVLELIAVQADVV